MEDSIYPARLPANSFYGHACAKRLGVRLLFCMRFGVLCMALLLGSALSGCVTDPLTGKSVLSFMSRQDEIALGMQGDSQIVAQYGIYSNAQVQQHVSDIGLKVAAI